MRYRKYRVVADGGAETFGYFLSPDFYFGKDTLPETAALKQVNEWNRIGAIVGTVQYTYWLDPADAEADAAT